jgi:hypothetical protein
MDGIGFLPSFNISILVLDGHPGTLALPPSVPDIDALPEEVEMLWVDH